jgi:hypothetical protein
MMLGQLPGGGINGETGCFTALEYRRRSDPDGIPSLHPGWKDPGANIGRLIVAGYMGKIDLVGPQISPTYPAGSTGPSDFAAARNDTNIAPFRFCPGQLGQGIELARAWETAYYFNPHWANMVGTKNIPPFTGPAPGYLYIGEPDVVTDRQEVTAFQKLGQYPNWAALACDMFYQFGTSAAHMATKQSATWNLLFSDGSVQSIKDRYVSSAIDPPNNRGVAAGFNRFDDYLDILETEALGRNPIQAIACPGVAADPQPLPNPAAYREGDYHSGLFAPND